MTELYGAESDARGIAAKSSVTTGLYTGFHVTPTAGAVLRAVPMFAPFVK